MKTIHGCLAHEVSMSVYSVYASFHSFKKNAKLPLQLRFSSSRGLASMPVPPAPPASHHLSLRLLLVLGHWNELGFALHVVGPGGVCDRSGGCFRRHRRAKEAIDTTSLALLLLVAGRLWGPVARKLRVRGSVALDEEIERRRHLDRCGLFCCCVSLVANWRMRRMPR